ncbi:MAG: Sua5/YciO/YrdC/YwlC family protein, tRNA threonylcarbamoyladenosine biosynthesis protein [Candidatus Peregrinibacteria bacterium GW2011_GWF2_38_29]|nr:MAG: Sua5/YciO/YrdC/YwlC family protein, tRNA threonylcarbamoyladenosine biosynthesis protein [Candidatus Peregrinibacteria bacterium GW2011_GWF2_38_29]
MKIEKITGQNIKNLIQKTITALKKGETIMHATETCYGFACDALNKKAISHLYRIKKMDAKKPSSIMVANLAQAQKYGELNALAKKLAKKYWPGPLTIIVPRKTSLPKFLNPNSKTIGIRCPADELTQKILRAYKLPLITTSANISGQKESYSIDAFLKSAPKNSLLPDLILDSNRIPKRKPSTVISIEKNQIKILRSGSMNIRSIIKLSRLTMNPLKSRP